MWMPLSTQPIYHYWAAAVWIAPIHHAAGPELLVECKTIGGCPTGEAHLTEGYNLPAKFVIHTVGPIWYGGKNKEEALLRDCYRNSMVLADENDIRTIAFPNISTGVYHFPKELAAEIAIRAVQGFLENNEKFKKVIFCCFDEENFSIYKSMITNRGFRKTRCVKKKLQ